MNKKKPIVEAPEKNFDSVINITQTAVYFSCIQKKTWDLCDATTINRQKNCNSTNRIAVAFAVSVSSQKLKPMLIFNGTPTGQIAIRELPTSPERDGLVLVCQHAAWQDNNVHGKVD